MPLDIPPDHMHVAFHHDLLYVTGEMVNTNGYDISGYVGTPQGALDHLSTNWGSTVQAFHSTGVQYVKATAQYHDPVFGMISLESVAGAIGGSGSTPICPLNVAIVVQKTTGFAGRKFRGRMFIGGFPVGALAAGSPNELDASPLGVLQAAFDTMKAANDAVNVLAVLLHPTTGPSPTLITSYDVHALVGNMRKRIR